MIVVAVALVAPEGHARCGSVLMQQRAFAGVHGGLWEFPGGKVEPGESPEDALVRELAEELGVTVAAADLAPVGFASGRTAAPAQGGKGPARPLVILLYMCGAWQGEPRALEAADVAWTAPDAIGALSMPPLDYPLAEALSRHLQACGK
ncbi:(deoxy)nucleoside triphosphate pyrophosphohydrolase [Novosphingobium resinovorum]|uniref:(deoxy)nucleoside triphosphate pyrophosphohydrolase n=1 Tax=Novosphingobium resinovorum TaxID=158500 RepID=UPI002ED62148|nr:(deoxy)nucleoside triphosphate pyrophosphohydrolase [Novosphingobium resinovorum]